MNERASSGAQLVAPTTAPYRVSWYAGGWYSYIVLILIRLACMLFSIYKNLHTPHAVALLLETATKLVLVLLLVAPLLLFELELSGGPMSLVLLRSQLVKLAFEHKLEGMLPLNDGFEVS